MMNIPIDQIPNSSDFTVIGSGPAGSSMAILLASQGQEVLLLEKEKLPRHKLCGEFLSSEAQAFLQRLGCLDAVLNSGAAHINQSRFTTASGKQVEFPLPGECLGISRYRLDDILFHQAEKMGVRASDGVAVNHLQKNDSSVNVDISMTEPGSQQKQITSNWVIGAYGRRSRLDRHLQREFLSVDHPYVGFKKHLRVQTSLPDPYDPLSNTVEIHTFSGGYCGLCYVEEKIINCCMLLEKSLLSRFSPVTWNNLTEFLSSQNPFLNERFRDLEPDDSPMQSVAQVPFIQKEKMMEGIFMIGDAAGLISPLCGDGQAMAMQSAFMLADLFQEKSGSSPAEIMGEWEIRWGHEFETRVRIGKFLQTTLFHPLWTDVLARAAHLFPRLPFWLARMTRSE